MRSGSFLLAFLLLAPVAWGASQGDPAGDEAAWTNPGTPLPRGALPCRDPRVDVTNVEVTSDGSNATVRLEVLDFGGRPSCGGQPFRGGGGVRGMWWVWVWNGTTQDGFVAYAYTRANGSLHFTYAVQNGTVAPEGALLASGVSGNVLTWTLPLSGTVPTYHDYRGRILHASGAAEEYAEWPSVLRFSDATSSVEVRT